MRRVATTFARAQVAVCHWFNSSIAHQYLRRSEYVLWINTRPRATYVPLAHGRVFAGSQGRETGVCPNEPVRPIFAHSF
jgi:hypothetical protein